MNKMVRLVTRRLTIILLFVLVISVISGCNKENEPLRLGTMPTYSGAIYAVGIEKGFFEEAGVEVDLTVFRSARDRDGAATSGQLDGFMTDIMGAINLNAKGFPFIVTSREYEEFGVMAGSHDDIKSDARSTIGISDNTVVEFIVDTYVQDTYIQESIEKVNIVALPDRMGALLSGKLDYGVFPEPFIGIILANKGQMVFNTTNEQFYPVVLVFDEKFIKDNELSMKAFYNGYAKTIEYMKSNAYSEYKDALVKHGLATEENVDLYKLPVDQYGLYSVDKNSFNSIRIWMEEKQLLDVEIEFDDINTSKYVEQ